MPSDDETATVPADLVDEVEAIVAILLEQRPELADNIAVVRPASRDFLGAGVGEVIFYAAGGALGWVTKQWLDDVLWPELKSRLEKPTARAVEFIFGPKPEGAANA